MTLNEAYVIIENKEENISFKKITGNNIKFHGCSNWNKGFVMDRPCTKVELFLNKKLIGQAGIDEDDYIFCVSIKPEFQSKGFGSKIMSQIEKYSKENTLYLRPANKELINFYKKLGYKKDHTDKYGLIMSKTI